MGSSARHSLHFAPAERANASHLLHLPSLERRLPRAGARRIGEGLDRRYLDLTKPIIRGILAFLSALAEDERNRILERGNDSRTAAKAKHTRFGRKPKS